MEEKAESSHQYEARSFELWYRGRRNPTRIISSSLTLPTEAWRGGVLLGQNVYDTSAMRGTTAGYSRRQGEFHSGTSRHHYRALLALQDAPPSCTVASAARSGSVAEAHSGRRSRIRGRADAGAAPRLPWKGLHEDGLHERILL
ncbi:hypothetical protein K438DRAFT_1966059 [Mycena galopus ATCC 62051]|nr:hypothetical protein K438DRAFT_1966059 [Mycena galopus ATCC 62051]